METLVASQFPSRSDGNPYVNLLKSSLGEWGVQSHEHNLYIGGRGPRFPTLDLQWLFRHRGRVNVLHFHWLQKFYRASSLEESAQKVALLADFLSLARDLDYRIAYTFHNVFPHEGMGRETDYRVRRLIIDHADVMTCFSRRQRSRLRKVFGPLSLAVIPHPGYVGYYPDHLSPEECRRLLGLPSRARVFTFIGLVRPYKNLSALIEEFTALSSREVYLVLAGTSLDAEVDQDFQATTRGMPRTRCCIRWIEDQEMQTFVKACDAVVLPSKQCWTSGTMMLAFSFGKPVVSADPIMLDDPEGLGFFYHNEAGLRAALLEASKATDRQLKEMGSRCLEYARLRPWSAAGQRLARAYFAARGKMGQAALADEAAAGVRDCRRGPVRALARQRCT